MGVSEMSSSFLILEVHCQFLDNRRRLERFSGVDERMVDFLIGQNLLSYFQSNSICFGFSNKPNLPITIYLFHDGQDITS
jgi:hypothetical protein